MGVTFPGSGRTWTIADFQGFQHAQPKSPDVAGTPAFPDGIFGDMLTYLSAVVGSIAANAAIVNQASALVAALAGATPALSSSTYNGVLAPNRTGSGYAISQFQIISSAAASVAANGNQLLFFDTSDGPFKFVQPGTPGELDKVTIADAVRKFGTNNLQFVFNGSIAGVTGATVVFDTDGHHMNAIYINGAWRLY